MARGLFFRPPRLRRNFREVRAAARWYSLRGDQPSSAIHCRSTFAQPGSLGSRSRAQIGVPGTLAQHIQGLLVERGGLLRSPAVSSNWPGSSRRTPRRSRSRWPPAAGSPVNAPSAGEVTWRERRPGRGDRGGAPARCFVRTSITAHQSAEPGRTGMMVAAVRGVARSGSCVTAGLTRRPATDRALSWCTRRARSQRQFQVHHPHGAAREVASRDVAG